MADVVMMEEAIEPPEIPPKSHFIVIEKESVHHALGNASKFANRDHAPLESANFTPT